jgi:CheY-like chemotaxis protein
MMTGRRVLVIDDNLQNRRLMADLLASFGHHAILAESGAEGLVKLTTESVDLVLLDVMMPDMDGFEVVRRLKLDPNTRMTPVVMVTALDDDGSRARLAAAGVDSLLTKPVDRWQLKSLLDRLLAIRDGATNESA